AISASSSSSSAQQAAVPAGTGEGSRLGGQWQIGGSPFVEMIEKGGRTWTKEEVSE
ncbi:unnamed protein product, partial [Closterium sp. NIES-54]